MSEALQAEPGGVPGAPAEREDQPALTDLVLPKTSEVDGVDDANSDADDVKSDTIDSSKLFVDQSEVDVVEEECLPP